MSWVVTMVIWYVCGSCKQRLIVLSSMAKGMLVMCRLFCRGGVVDSVVVPSSLSESKPTVWTVDEEGNIHFTLTSNGFTREQWEQHLSSRGWRIGDCAGQVLCRAREAPTNGVIYNIVVRPGKKTSDRDNITKKIRAYAKECGWLKPHWEVSCLIRDTFTDEQLEVMGLWYIATMHEPIKNSDGDLSLLYSSRYDGGCWLGAGYGRPGGGWNERGGFAFVEPQDTKPGDSATNIA